jgi:hypothetical protein
MSVSEYATVNFDESAEKFDGSDDQQQHPTAIDDTSSDVPQTGRHKPRYSSVHATQTVAFTKEEAQPEMLAIPPDGTVPVEEAHALLVGLAV